MQSPGKRASKNRCIAEDKATCRDRSGALPRSPFLAHFRVVDQPL